MLTRRLLSVMLSLFGYVHAGPVLLTSNSIKNFEPVSPSPGTPQAGGVGHRAPAQDILQINMCADDEECGAEEFCNDVRGVCQACRKNRKRCGRDAVCCAGSRCSNGVCQTNELDTLDVKAWHVHKNNTMELKKTITSLQAHTVKGQEGDTCLRSSDCQEDLCCARHFWSRICKPVLSEGQVCTRHRRKGAHGLELFQRCDCGDGLACRPERGQRERRAAARTAARNLHTCQRR
ncbi:dickkopf-related protein 1-like [Corythoichthys intestinalis]|uniref:dickkopf-related protein 1-like n=1 Tax=Corythoichthys intestinalis TaxID=161448 RepID=UPI0025A54F6F|nr:dickkopf-related protein 1-like [Corythoichthys intestinalis]XP_057703292.1 dickkopf-related protein 1-like [Corythoichthys intestinalis]XP_061794444.1 dickkopf-related protein 1-like [Nerophis lumbriciformis]